MIYSLRSSLLLHKLTDFFATCLFITRFLMVRLIGVSFSTLLIMRLLLVRMTDVSFFTLVNIEFITGKVDWSIYNVLVNNKFVSVIFSLTENLLLLRMTGVAIDLSSTTILLSN